MKNVDYYTGEPTKAQHYLRIISNPHGSEEMVELWFNFETNTVQSISDALEIAFGSYLLKKKKSLWRRILRG